MLSNQIKSLNPLLSITIDSGPKGAQRLGPHPYLILLIGQAAGKGTECFLFTVFLFFALLHTCILPMYFVLPFLGIYYCITLLPTRKKI